MNESATWYKVLHFDNSIWPKDVFKHTDASVWIMDRGEVRRFARSTAYETYFPTLTLAVQFSKRRAQREIESLYHQMARVESVLRELYAKYPAEYDDREVSA